MSWKKKATGTTTSSTDAGIQHDLKAQMFLPDSVFKTIVVDAFQRTPVITWATPTKVEGELLSYSLRVDTSSKGRDGQSTLLQVHYNGLVDKNGQRIVRIPSTSTPVATTTTPTSSNIDNLVNQLVEQRLKALLSQGK